jgi:hypothetical protein
MTAFLSVSHVKHSEWHLVTLFKDIIASVLASFYVTQHYACCTLSEHVYGH